MNELEQEIIKNAVKKIEDLTANMSNLILSENIQLEIAQMDLMKTLASLVMAISAIGYITGTDFDQKILILSFLFGLITLIFSVSGNREKIDLRAKDGTILLNRMSKQEKEVQEVAQKAFKDQKFQIYEDYVTNREKPSGPSTPSYIGEVTVFLFYNSVGFLIASSLPLLAKTLDIHPIDIYTKYIIYMSIPVISLVLSFSDWFNWVFVKFINPVCHYIFNKNTNG